MWYCGFHCYNLIVYHIPVYLFRVPPKFLILSVAVMQQCDLSNLYTCPLLWASKLKEFHTLQICMYKINLVFGIATENEN
jgi:hypothetical protein